MSSSERRNPSEHTPNIQSEETVGHESDPISMCIMLVVQFVQQTCRMVPRCSLCRSIFPCCGYLDTHLVSRAVGYRRRRNRLMKVAQQLQHVNEHAHLCSRGGPKRCSRTTVVLLFHLFHTHKPLIRFTPHPRVARCTNCGSLTTGTACEAAQIIPGRQSPVLLAWRRSALSATERYDFHRARRILTTAAAAAMTPQVPTAYHLLRSQRPRTRIPREAVRHPSTIASHTRRERPRRLQARAELRQMTRVMVSSRRCPHHPSSGEKA